MPRILSQLKEFSLALHSAQSIKQISQSYVKALAKLLGVQQITLIGQSTDTDYLEFLAIHGLIRNELQIPKIEWTDQLNFRLDQKAEILTHDSTREKPFLIIKDPNQDTVYDCEYRIPLFVNHSFFAVTNLGQKRARTDYTETDIELMQILSNFCCIALERIISTAQTIPSEERKKSSFHVMPSRSHDEMQGHSEKLQKVDEIIDCVAEKDVSVLITGESGTGKELVARKIHKLSLRKSEQLVTMNCAALPANLIESELFGHEKGAFTHAFTQKKGRFEIANNSTLFLDEVADMTLEAQAKLLRVLQDGSFQRVGGSHTLHTNARIIAATNKNLELEIQNNRFRQDLFYRLNVVQISLPPLRERDDDIFLLAEYFIQKFNRNYSKQVCGLTEAAREKLKHYRFPGNIRELQNIIERAVLLENSATLNLDFLELSDNKKAAGNQTVIPHQNCQTLEDLEHQHIEQVLRSVQFNKSKASRILGIARKTLREKIQKYHLTD